MLRRSINKAKSYGTLVIFLVIHSNIEYKLGIELKTIPSDKKWFKKSYFVDILSNICSTSSFFDFSLLYGLTVLSDILLKHLIAKGVREPLFLILRKKY